MHMRALQLLLIEAVGLLVLSPATQAQAPAPAPATNGPAAVSPTSQALGVIVYPAKNQTAQQQSVDESECYNWAKSNTGIDPQAPAPTVAASEEGKPKGQRVKSAARGA